MPKRAPEGRNVKSRPGRGTTGAADGHERAKDFLTAAELAALLEAAKADRHGTRDHLLLMTMFRHDLRLIQDYLSHRDFKRTVRYTRTAGRRFEGVWR